MNEAMETPQMTIYEAFAFTRERAWSDDISGCRSAYAAFQAASGMTSREFKAAMIAADDYDIGGVPIPMQEWTAEHFVTIAKIVANKMIDRRAVNDSGCCQKCGGRGHLKTYSHVDFGVCYACGGHGAKRAKGK